MKIELKLFKSLYGRFTNKQLIPCFKFSKNVQGWFFSRNWWITWFRYCLLFTITKQSDFNQDRNIAHKKNVARYMLLSAAILTELIY